MDNRPHYVWAFVVIGGLCLIAWIYSANRSDVSNYGKDSTHNEQTHNNYGLVVLQPGCQNSKAESFMKALKENKNATLTNSMAK